MVAVYNLASMLIQNMSKIDNLIMVTKDIIDCYGEMLVAMDTDMLLSGADNRFPQITISYSSKYAEN